MAGDPTTPDRRRDRRARRLLQARHRLRTLLATLAAATATAALTTSPVAVSGAWFTDTASVGANTVSTATLAAPSNLAAAVAGTQVTLTWSATPSTFADGYIVQRATSSSGPWTSVHTATGRATTSWTDTSPGTGTVYYRIYAYTGNWQSPTATSGAVTLKITVSDEFTGSGALGATEVGNLPWTALTGTWSRTSGRATTSTSVGSNPLAVIDPASPDVDTAIPVSGGGEAVYVRVADATNWLRARLRRYQQTETYQYYVTEYQHQTYGTEYQYYDYVYVTEYQYSQTTYTFSDWTGYQATGEYTTCRDNGAPTSGTNTYYGASGQPIEYNRWSAFQNCTTGGNAGKVYEKQKNYRVEYANTSYTWATSSPGSGWSATGSSRQTTQNSGSTYWATSARDGIDQPTGSSRQVVTGSYWDTNYCSGCSTRQAGPYTGSYQQDYYTVIVEKSVAGTITSLGSTSATTSPPSQVRAVALGTSIKVYLSGSSTAALSLTESTHASATRHGIGYAGPTYATPAGIESYTLETLP